MGIDSNDSKALINSAYWSYYLSIPSSCCGENVIVPQLNSTGRFFRRMGGTEPLLIETDPNSVPDSHPFKRVSVRAEAQTEPARSLSAIFRAGAAICQGALRTGVKLKSFSDLVSDGEETCTVVLRTADRRRRRRTVEQEKKKKKILTKDTVRIT